jgi:hypothetical protein
VSLGLLLALGLLGLGLMVTAGWRERRAAAADPDADTVAALRAAGADPGQPHRIEFYLYFPAAEVADRVAEELRTQGFDTAVQPDDGAADWLCLASRTMVPDVEELRRLRSAFVSLALTHQGAYDGWGAEVAG